MVQLQQQRQADRNFRRCHRQDEDEHDLPIWLSPSRARYDEGKACCVQHDLDRHQDEEQVTTHEKPDQSQRKQDCRQRQAVAHGNREHSVFPP